MTTLLRAKDLSYGIDGRPPLGQGISFELHTGQLLHVSGPNGAGKSTLLKVLLGQHRARSGNVERRVPPSEIEILPQLQNLHFHFPVTLRDVLAISVDGDLDEERVLGYGLLEAKHLGLRWNTASGGERKRTLLTRILLQDPKLLFLDEPLNHLDPESKRLVTQAMKDFLAKSGRAAVWISHSGNLEKDLGGLMIQRIELGEKGARE